MDTGFLDHKSSPLEFLKNKKKLKKERKRKKIPWVESPIKE